MLLKLKLWKNEKSGEGGGGEGEEDLVFFRGEGGEGGDEGRFVGEDVEGLSGGVADFVCRDFSRVNSVCKGHRLGVEIDGKHYRTRRGTSSVVFIIVIIIRRQFRHRDCNGRGG